MANEDKSNEKKSKSDLPESQGRRNAIKALATVPVLGTLAYGVYKKKRYDNTLRDVSDVFNVSKNDFTITGMQPGSERIRLGIIGCGIRGKQLLRAAGFATPEAVQKLIDGAKENSKDTRYKDYLAQEDLNIELKGVCDIFDTYAAEGIAAGANIHKEGIGGKPGNAPRRYRTYQELLAADDIDAVI
ncbi:MAG: gfo/Idh/MocA family oxidoreductase, partial [Dysgonamonadaceae bacterium]|nr:gfo/Idh/MocA family oxidoreductase [Dysgonamonadaceae bacterium]